MRTSGMYDFEVNHDGRREFRTVPTEYVHVLIRSIREELHGKGYEFSGSIKDDYYAVK